MSPGKMLIGRCRDDDAQHVHAAASGTELLPKSGTAVVSSITVFTYVTRESRRSRALVASAGQRQDLLTVGAQRALWST